MITYLNTEMSAEEFLLKLRMIMPQDCKPYETVVFFDEIQKCPEIVTKIKGAAFYGFVNYYAQVIAVDYSNAHITIETY